MSLEISISVIATVYNEANAIHTLLDSLMGQTRQPDEIVICDGGSTDGTVEQIEAYISDLPLDAPPIRLLVQPGANISQGRNTAISAATGIVIAVTDAGVRLSVDWLEQLTAPWLGRVKGEGRRVKGEGRRVKGEGGRVKPDVVSGFFYPDVDDVFTVAMGATVLPLVDDIAPQKFLPSSRSIAFTKEAWASVGGYPEWLDYCEDLVYDLMLRQKHEKASTDDSSWHTWAPNATVAFRPRENFRAFGKQYYLYARGDGKADLWRKRHLIRYVTYLLLIPALLGHIGWGFFARWLGWVGLVAGVIAYCWRPWQRIQVLGQHLSPAERWQAALFVPIIRVVGDVAKMIGYPAGLWWRWQNRERDEIRWQ
ncbi:MAG: glycosyltransferase [Chloroflexota bacterium]